MQLYPTKLTRNLKAEFYGKNYVVLAPEVPRNLRQVRARGSLICMPGSLG